MTKTDEPQHSGSAAPSGDPAEVEFGLRGSFRKLVGYTTDVWRENYAEIGLDIRGDHLNSLDNVHGGIYVTLLDAAFGHAVTYCGMPGRIREAVTVTLTTSFLGAASKAGRIVARGHVIGVEGRVASVKGEVVDAEGRVCTRGQGTFLYLPGSENPAGIPKRKRGIGRV